MRTMRVLISFFMFITVPVWAASTFAGNDCVHCGGEQGSHEVEISEMDTIVFCNSHKTGRISAAREYGAKLFGSREEFFKNYHRIQCPPYYPSPLYHSIEEQAFEYELIKELEYIKEILTEEERKYLLNRPDKGRRKATILDMAYISHTIATRAGNEEAAEKYVLIREKLEEMGAKRSDDLGPTQLARYK